MTSDRLMGSVKQELTVLGTEIPPPARAIPASLRPSGRRAITAVVSAAPPQIFDRALLAARLDRAWRGAGERPGADFLLRRAADEFAERLALVKRGFAVAVDAGAPGPHAATALAARPGGGATLRLAPTAVSAGSGDFSVLIGDLEHLPLAADSADLVVSLLALHHVNDLPGAMIQIRRVLRPDGLFLAALAGGDTLTELRQSLTIAESELSGGVSPRVAPFADLRDLGALLQRAGFALPVTDTDRLTVRYDSAFGLMRDLRQFDPFTNSNDPLLNERIQSALAGVEQVEMELRRKVEDTGGNGSVRSPGGEKVPQGYADAVAEYYRKLSKSK